MLYSDIFKTKQDAIPVLDLYVRGQNDTNALVLVAVSQPRVGPMCVPVVALL